jgi:hypothetical protein
MPGKSNRHEVCFCHKKRLKNAIRQKAAYAIKSAEECSPQEGYFYLVRSIYSGGPVIGPLFYFMLASIAVTL